MLASSPNSSEWKNDDKWSSQVRKSGVSNKLVIATESNLSLKSRSFLNRMNDRLRKILDRSPEDPMQDVDKRSIIWEMFMSSTLEASVFLGKNNSVFFHSIKNTGKDLTLKQMFDISENLIVGQSDAIDGVNT